MQKNQTDNAHLIPLTDRGLLLLTGEQVDAFLQGLTTCNINNLTPDNALYGVHLTHQGRVLYDFFALRWKNGIILDCHKETLMAFAKNLHSHKMRYDIEFEDLSDDYFIYADIQQSSPPGHRQDDGDTITYGDPRLPVMGTRLITPHNLTTTQTLDTYHDHRIHNTVPDVAFDGTPGKTIVSELCLEYLNGVDYYKGCYMGQEMTARTHFRSPPKKRLAAVEYEGDAPAPNTPIKAGKLPVGEIYSCHNGHGIAIVRVAKALAADAVLTADGQPVTAKKPAWADYSIE